MKNVQDVNHVLLKSCCRHKNNTFYEGYANTQQNFLNNSDIMISNLHSNIWLDLTVLKCHKFKEFYLFLS
jgi:hypothetical protein